RGVLTDTNGREANFKNVVIVMTTNAGAAQASRRSIGFTRQDHSTDAMEVIRRSFSPEFRNRLDAVVQFQPLGFDHILRVVDKFLIELEMQLNEKHVAMTASPNAREWLAQHGFDPLMGARPMARVIQDRIKRPLADELLFGKLVNGGRVNIEVVEGELVVEAQSEPEKVLPATLGGAAKRPGMAGPRKKWRQCLPPPCRMRPPERAPRRNLSGRGACGWRSRRR